MAETGDEQRWIRDSLAGDESAYAALVGRYQRMIHGLTYRMTGSLEDAEDLAQETFLRAFDQLHSFRGDSKFSTWLCRIAINACLNWRQREARRGEVHRRWASEHPAIDSGASDAAGAASQRIQDVLTRLPAKQRAAIILTIFEGMNHAEAGQVLGCSETTVSWRIFVGRTKLKRWLKTFTPS
jgi:RNA polymerase sigma-70 factor (ECF subfamily)